MLTIFVDLYAKINSFAGYEPFLFPIMNDGELKVFWNCRAPVERIDHDKIYSMIKNYLSRKRIDSFQLVFLMGVKDQFEENHGKIYDQTISSRVKKINLGIVERLCSKGLASRKVYYLLIDPFYRSGYLGAPHCNATDYACWEIDNKGFIETKIHNFSHRLKLGEINDISSEGNFEDEVVNLGLSALSLEKKEELTRLVEAIKAQVSEFFDPSSHFGLKIKNKVEDDIEARINFSIANIDESLHKAKEYSLNIINKRFNDSPEAFMHLNITQILEDSMRLHFSLSGILPTHSYVIRVPKSSRVDLWGESDAFRIGTALSVILKLSESRHTYTSTNLLYLDPNIEVDKEQVIPIIHNYINKLEYSYKGLREYGDRAVKGVFDIFRENSSKYKKLKKNDVEQLKSQINDSSLKSPSDEVFIRYDKKHKEALRINDFNVNIAKNSLEIVKNVTIDDLEEEIIKIERQQDEIESELKNMEYENISNNWDDNLKGDIAAYKYTYEVSTKNKKLLIACIMVFIFMCWLAYSNHDYNIIVYSFWGTIVSFIITKISLCIKQKNKYNNIRHRIYNMYDELGTHVDRNIEYLSTTCKKNVLLNNISILKRELSKRDTHRLLVLYHTNKMRSLLDFMKVQFSYYDGHTITQEVKIGDEIELEKSEYENTIYHPEKGLFIPSSVVFINESETNIDIDNYPYKKISLVDDVTFKASEG